MSDSREIAAHTGGGAVAAAPATGIPVEQRMAMLREALVNPDVDPAKAVAMADLMFKLEDRDREREFNSALIAAKAEIGPIFKRGHNKHQNTKYAKFEDIQRVTDPILAKHGLDMSYKIGSEGPNITVVPVIRHLNGWEWEGLAIKGPPDTGPGRSAIQSVGSSASYLQRYAAKGALNLRFDGEDDDAVPVREGDQVNDRQAGLIVDAQAAHERGEYAAWYRSQTVKDKALLVTLRVHEKYSGGPALPGPAEERQPEPQREERREEPPAEQQRQRRTPEQQVDAYEAKVKAAKSIDDLRDLQTDEATSKWIAGMREKHPELHERILKINSDRFAELSGPADAAAEEQSGAASGGDLFGAGGD